MTEVFAWGAKMDFGYCYPETPHLLDHMLEDHELLSLDALARLGETLPEQSVEYNRAVGLPIGIEPDQVEANGLSIGDTIRTVENNGSWAVLKNIEQVPAYEKLLMDLLGELQESIEAKTGEMMTPEGFIFVSSPDAVTPFHFDPEHNLLLQIKGTKVMTQFPAADERIIPLEEYERYHIGGHRNLVWKDDFCALGTDYALRPGKAVFVPVMAPHHVKNGPQTSISLSITWRSDWSYAEKDAHMLNAALRKFGVHPQAPGRFPDSNKAKAYGWRALRKTGIGPRLVG